MSWVLSGVLFYIQDAVSVGLERGITKDNCVIMHNGLSLCRHEWWHFQVSHWRAPWSSNPRFRGKGGPMHIFTPSLFGGMFALYGDGVSNQRQVFEAYNMVCALNVSFRCRRSIDECVTRPSY